MEIYHDDELARLENGLYEFANYLDNMLMTCSAIMEPEVDEIYRDAVSEIRAIKNTAVRIASQCAAKRVDVHKTASFNEAYYLAYGSVHPDAIGIIDEHIFEGG